MLYKNEKLFIEQTMEMFAESGYDGEKLIKQTARYVSDNLTTWKRAMVYSYSRELYHNMFDDEDLYMFTYKGVEEAWNCTLWYDGPRIFESKDKTRILIQKKEHSQLEQFTMFHISYDNYSKLVEEKKSLDNILTEEFYIYYKDFDLHEWSDDLYNTKPEIFI